ncbi:hypothetical protein GB931_16060 [Modestobacter sp. I12A-02628]|uniref:Uncharacterized protein n=1 Tax=Goekera deserti TaxID=2497753 RepID=A0A7K3WGV4_9ACTN|nr:hypothetical protein [Goekera deserti]MPQ99405.1 hypothetical protein [Goekera deserti]NDI48892.1 hypothetical protein [Goekera deserti]NEL55637.1 hypothetical protein [Goekera deserti]
MTTAARTAPPLPAPADPSPPAPLRPAPVDRRAPAPVVAAAGVCFLEALVLLTAGLAGMGSQLAVPGSLPGLVVVVLLLALSGWVVLTALGGATLLDGAGRELLHGVAVGELALLTGVVLLGLLAPGSVPVADVGGLPALPVPLLALLAAAVPLGKLALAGAPTAVAWVAAGGSPVRRAARRVAPLDPRQREVRAVTLVVIGCTLTALAVLAPAGPATSTVGTSHGTSP